MQRILCINDKPIPGTFNIPEALSLIKEGQEYEGIIVDTRTPSGQIKKGWRIPSIYNGRDSYNINRFVPVGSDLDETTLVNEEWEEKVCEPVNSQPCV